MNKQELLSGMFAVAREKALRHATKESEQMTDEGKAWNNWGRTWDNSTDRIKHVLQEGESLTSISRSIREKEGQLILLDIGSNHNPIPDRARDPRDIVVAVGLQEWRRTPKGEIDHEWIQRDEDSGFFLITKPIGTPEAFDEILALMGKLYATGRSISPFFNMVTSTMHGGWASLPIYPQVNLQQRDSLPYDTYREWLGRQIRGVAPHAEIILDAPEAVGEPFVRALADLPRVRVTRQFDAVRVSSRRPFDRQENIAV